MPNPRRNEAFRPKRYGVLLAILLLASLLPGRLFAQVEQDTTSVKFEDKLEQKEARLDSAQQRLDSLTIRSEARFDSLQSKTDQALNKTSELTGKVNSLTDSIKPDLNHYNRKLDSLKHRLTFRIDSLNRMGEPTEKYRNLLDSINQSGPFKQVDKAEQKIADLQKKVTKPINKVTNPINEKLAIMNREGGDQAGIPGQVGVPGMGVPGVNTPGVPRATVPGMPNTGLPGVDSGGLPNVDTGIGEIQDPLKDINGLPDQELGKIGELEKGKEMLGQVGEVAGQVKGYGEELKNMKEGGLGEEKSISKAAEGQVMKMEDMQGVQGNMSEVNKMKEMAGSGNDPDAMKKVAADEVRKKAVDHFAGKGDQLKNAMQKVSAMKQKYSSIKSIKDLQKKPPNPMKGKPFIERLVPGLVMQFQSSNHFLLDLNPVMGYKFGGRVNAGLGWNHRLAFGSRLRIFPEERIYGPRVYGEFQFGKGFAVRTDIEKMNTYIPPFGLVGPATDGRRAWVWSAFVGLKKEYKLSKHVNGNFQFLYNLYDDHDNSPYADRLVVRTGFEFPQKKKVKKKK
ncbi:MAG: hypothetical protein AB7O48_15370 [Cyclobacteriaceae bacterium]